MSSAAAEPERNADTLDRFIRQGDRVAALFAAKAEAALELPDGEMTAVRLMAGWGRITRRTMQAMVMDRRFAKENASESERTEASKALWESTPADQRKMKDIIEMFRVEGIDRDDEFTLKDLLEEMESTGEVAEFPTVRLVHRICQALDWEMPEAAVEAARKMVAAEKAAKDAEGPPPSGEVAPQGPEGVTPEANAAPSAPTPEGTPSVRCADSSPQGGATERPDTERPSATVHELAARFDIYERAKRQRAERDRRERLARGEDPDSS
jgi:hypothetical protein